ncbi:MAG: hypothetical protein JXR94_07495 [Candidatus Hydrogenedentes bacterium]|nr:hypothetical protein [Candidatus Hydrogenedentota bacterium]
MSQKVYIETSIVSYLASRRSRDMVIAAHQEITLQWWEHLANAAHRCQIEAIVEKARYACPIICTPEELMEN